MEARVTWLSTPADVDAYVAVSAQWVAKCRQRVILCADHRPVMIYPPEIADRFIGTLRNMNPKLERVALVVTRSNATLAMQLERLVRAAEFDGRRVCYTPEDAVSYLSGCLNVTETGRLRAFLAEWRPQETAGSLSPPPRKKRPSVT